MGEIIYLDNAATTKPDAAKLRAAVDYCNEYYFNPSTLYRGGRKVSADMTEWKNTLLGNYSGKKIIFTSCGTEADNTAVFGFSKHGNVVTTMGEHPAVYNAFMKLKEKGTDVRVARLMQGGGVDVADLLSKVDSNTSFVSVVHVNSETGAINPINEIASSVKKINPKCVFHSDGVQAFGKLNIRLSHNVDLYSVSAHKIGGLKGTGGLIAESTLNVPPLIVGGWQENGQRSGTENVLGIKLFADVYREKIADIADNMEYVKSLNGLVCDTIDKSLFRILSPQVSSPYIVTLSAMGLRGAVLQNMLDDEGILVGTGSACSSKKPFSRIISSFEADPHILHGVIRLSFTSYTKTDDVKFAVNRLNYNALKLKEMLS